MLAFVTLLSPREATSQYISLGSGVASAILGGYLLYLTPILKRVKSEFRAMPEEKWVAFAVDEQSASWVRWFLVSRLRKGEDHWITFAMVSLWRANEREKLYAYANQISALGELQVKARIQHFQSLKRSLMMALPAVIIFCGCLVSLYTGNLGLAKIAIWGLIVAVIYPFFLMPFIRKQSTEIVESQIEILRTLPNEIVELLYAVPPLGLYSASVLHERLGEDKSVYVEAIMRARSYSNWNQSALL
ncbi:MAG: hypothetical protein KF836_00685 [Fimbriimonadaceae bacterium]|nr:hypothetical protein [Fimbriimonadaceae bacterium]